MDGLREPVGGQPPEVYWRRRIVAIVGAVLLLVVLYFLVSSPGGDEKDGATGTTPNPDDATAQPSDDATAGAGGDVTRACTPTDVTLATTPNTALFGAGALPVFDVSITHTGTAPCLLDTAAADTEFVVWSGGEDNKDIYYSTTYCPSDPTVTAREFLLQPGAKETFSVTWSRQRVNAECTPAGDPAAGYYWSQLTIQGIAAEPSQFQLAD